MEVGLHALAAGLWVQIGSSKLNSCGLRGTQGVPAVVGDHWTGAPPAVNKTEEGPHNCLGLMLSANRAPREVGGSKGTPKPCPKLHVAIAPAAT